ncbi:ABC transporter permease subunit [Aliiglaciecola sp. LCG003]|uniref:ABC transporter permease subunit n=1 Tax=Aliiglaciecola sp. LCG003 TaxID=3053655 RepID=UPI002572AFCD|nr:ABC transporter permease subunit [Aliiglaciecola sp. LCG003]WJG08637.1 ABC transporter permease subunit [Aliiglaciecola sp. LCG003]
MENGEIGKIAQRRRVKNRLIAYLIGIAGWCVLLMLGLLLWHLVVQVLPLWKSVQIEPAQQYRVPEGQNIILMGDFTHGDAMASYDSLCRLNFLSLSNTSSMGQSGLQITKTIPTLCDDQVKVKSYGGELYVARLSQSGLLRIEKLTQLQNHFESQLEMSIALDGANPNQPIDSYDFELSDSLIMLSVVQDDRWQVISLDRQRKEEVHRATVIAQKLLVLLPRIGQFMYVRDQSLVTQLIGRDDELISPVDKPVTFLQALPSQRSVFVGLANSKVQKWSVVNQAGVLNFVPVYALAGDISPLKIHVHQTENAAVAFTDNQNIVLFNYVTGETLLAEQQEFQYQDSFLAQDHLFVYQQQSIQSWKIKALSAVNTVEALWGKVQYEGYKQADYVWQTTYATDFQEVKFSIVPLVIGSLKASLLALLIAVPLALSAAIYTAYFAPQKMRNWMKSSIEMLEAIPSVVLGFIAAIWLAPLAEQFLLSLFLFILLIPLVLIVFAFFHQPLVARLPQRFKEGWELPVVAILLLLNGIFVIWVTEPFTAMQSQSEVSSFYSVFSFDALNSVNKSTLVVALALGIAIVPSIYSLAEDALFEVPSSLKQASSALGATRLQTLRKVVLVLAYPGILSAIALGLGRAFGETMIVLMITGNTPVADWDLLSGIRTLTANLAIELPEAEVASSHYQILFLTALVLFMFTFVLNSIAELLRYWLRKNYKHG